MVAFPETSLILTEGVCDFLDYVELKIAGIVSITFWHCMPIHVGKQKKKKVIFSYPRDIFTFLEPQDHEIGEFYVCSEYNVFKLRICGRVGQVVLQSSSLKNLETLIFEK